MSSQPAPTAASYSAAAAFRDDGLSFLQLLSRAPSAWVLAPHSHFFLLIQSMDCFRGPSTHAWGLTFNHSDIDIGGVNDRSYKNRHFNHRHFERPFSRAQERW